MPSAWKIFAAKGLGWLGLAVLSYVLPAVFLGQPIGFLAPLILLAGGAWFAFGDRTALPPKSQRTAQLLVSGFFLALAVMLSTAPKSHMQWQPYSEEAMAAARTARRPVMIDFYADWCAGCREMDETLFSRPEVGVAAKRFVQLRADLTHPTDENRAISERYSAMVLPMIAFFGSDGQEITRLRLIGVESPTRFVARMQAVQ